jgi:CBS domain-containing protein
MKSSIPISALLHQKGSAMWTIPPDATVYEAIKLMAEKNVGSLLVLSDGKLVGLFTERDYARKIVLQGKSSKDTRVREIFTGVVITVKPQDSVEDCMKLMTEHRVRHLPVVEKENVVGIVSIGDLVNWTISAQDAQIAQMEQYIAGGVAS